MGPGRLLLYIGVICGVTILTPLNAFKIMPGGLLFGNAVAGIVILGLCLGALIRRRPGNGREPAGGPPVLRWALYYGLAVSALYVLGGTYLALKLTGVPGRPAAVVALDILVGPASLAVCWGCLRNLGRA